MEGATSNVFALRGGSLVTPPEASGILPGITRAILIDLAREFGLPLELRSLPVDEALSADELFICSSIRELLPVVRLDGRPIGSGEVGPWSRELLRAFREKVRYLQGLRHTLPV